MNFSRATKIKATITFFSIFLIGLGIALLRLSSLGVDPGSSFSFSISILLSVLLLWWSICSCLYRQFCFTEVQSVLEQSFRFLE